MLESPTHHLPIGVRIWAVLALIALAGCAGPEEKAQNYYQRGTELLSRQDYAKASIEFRNALQLKKDMVGAWRGLLQVEEHNHNSQAELPILRNIVELDPKDVESRVKLGRYLLAGNALDQALELENAAIELDPKNVGALAVRGAARLKLNDAAGAKRDAQTALNIDPAAAEPLVVLAAERANQGDVEAALTLLDRKPQSNDLSVQIYKLSLFEKKRDIPAIEASLRELAEHYPKERVFHQALVKFYIDQKRNADAEKEIRSLATADPSNIDAELDVARFLRQTKGSTAAHDELSARIKAGGDVFRYQLASAELDFSDGRTADAIQALEKLIQGQLSPQNAIAAELRLAQMQARVGKFDAAETLVADVLSKDRRNDDGLKLRAALSLEKGNFDSAISDLREALNDQPRAADVMALLAAAYERAGSIELAEKQYADATNISNFSPQIGLQYVTFLRRRGNQDRADEVLNELIARSPQDLALLKASADARLERQDWAGAQAVAEQIERLSGSGALSAQISAAALSGRGDYANSIKILENTYSADSANSEKSSSALASLVNTMVRGQQSDRAVTFLQRLLKENPANAEARVLLGTVLLSKNLPKDAVENYKAAISQQPKFAAAYVALASYHLRARNYDDAEKVLRSGLAQDPDDFSLHLTLAGALEAKGNYDGAIAEYELLLKQQPGSLVVANNLASLLADRRADSASLERAYALAATLRKSPIPAFKDTLGWIYLRRGEVKNAVPLLEDAATALSNQSMVQYHLGMAYLENSQTAKAADQFKKALGLNPDETLKPQILSAQQKAAM
jgi:tetratricopeptide (TPR) repeat protein